MSELPVRWCLAHNSSAVSGTYGGAERCGEWATGHADEPASCDITDATLNLPDDRQLVCRRNV